MSIENKKMVTYYAHKNWFKWYDTQVLQAQRSERTNMQWSANDGEKTYNSLQELDEEANIKQQRIKQLRQELE